MSHNVYIIMTGVDHNRMLAIHQVRDSAEALFLKLAREKQYSEELKLIRFTLDHNGMLTKSTLLFTYTESEGIRSGDDDTMRVVFS